MTTNWHLKHEVHGDKPWTVQVEAMRRAAGFDRFGQWLEQGLGKGPLSINEFVDSDDVDVCVVIAPNSFKLDWVLWPQEWGVGFIQTGMWPKDPLPFDSECALYAINYESVRYSKDSRNNGFNALMQLLERRRCMLVIDESKAIGNPSSGTTRGVLELAKRAKMVRLLNGTPMTESVMDYFGQLRALGLLEGWNPTAFKKRYAEVGGFMGRTVIGIKPEREQELAKIIDSKTFRALKTDWRKDLPLQTYVPVHLEMTAKQRSHYQTMMEEFYAAIGDDTVTAELIITQRDKLRQISSCLLMDDGKAHWLEQPKDNPKLKGMLDILNSGPTKSIVVYLYKESGKAIFETLTKAGRDPAYIRGGMSPDELKFQKDKFNKDPSCRDIVAQEVAGARGHTLLGQKGKERCNRMIFYENHDGLYWREQMKDRNHRGEQDQECLLFDLITSPMDQIVVDGLIRKKTAAETMDALVREVRKSHGKP